MANIVTLRDKNENVLIPRTSDNAVQDEQGLGMDKRYQKNNDDKLNTKSKNIVEAINEINNKGYTLALNGNTLSILCNGTIVSSVTIPTGGGEIESFGNIVISANSISINESSQTSLKVKLDNAPTNNQIVSISISNEYCTIDKTKLTFTSSNFSVDQTININSISVESDTTSVITISSSNVESKTVQVSIKNVGEITPPDSGSYNIYTNEEFNTTGFFNPDNGTLKTDGTYGSCKKIEVLPSKEFTFNGVNGCFFDADNNYVSGIPFNSTVPKTINTPATAKYFSFAISKNSKDSGYLYYTPIPTDHIEKGVNVITNATITEGGYYNDKGEFVSDNNVNTTENIKVEPNVTITTSNILSVRGFNKYGVGGVIASNNQEKQIPYGYEYIRVGFNKTSANTASVIIT